MPLVSCMLISEHDTEIMLIQFMLTKCDHCYLRSDSLYLFVSGVCFSCLHFHLHRVPSETGTTKNYVLLKFREKQLQIINLIVMSFYIWGNFHVWTSALDNALQACCMQTALKKYFHFEFTEKFNICCIARH